MYVLISVDDVLRVGSYFLLGRFLLASSFMLQMAHIYQKDESVIADQIGHSKLLSRLVVQIYHLRANRVENVVVLIQFLDIMVQLESQLRHVPDEFVFTGHSHGVNPAGSDRAFVGPAYSFGDTQMQREKLV